MRQKKIKGISKASLLERGIIGEPKFFSFDENKRVNLEVGSGKGLFITSLARDYKDEIFVAFEKNISVCYRILEKKEAYMLDNLFIVLDDAKHLEEYFHLNQVDCIYLNFSDPWPKSKHHKRRLTNQTFLDSYHNILKDKGLIQFRTDHNELFLDSIEYIKNSKLFRIINKDENLKESKYMSEYEIKKRAYGNINQLVGEKIWTKN
ncbi:tRNA (guanosine(46)-N7)-methyltransferase TrmB [Acholeplasma sp. OttesenSCG-928-E16]|nr:tRNA (guanosine(46)-N7)-methyltransferase TrmB [Acholeplasma sp. OttesenSCG-928-E16]